MNPQPSRHHSPSPLPKSSQPVNYRGYLWSRQENLNLMLVTWIRHICPGVRCDRREERKEATRMRTDQGQWASSGLPLPALSFQLFTCDRGGGVGIPSVSGSVALVQDLKMSRLQLLPLENTELEIYSCLLMQRKHELEVSFKARQL